MTALALAETSAQADAALAEDERAVVVAMTPAVDFWRELRGRSDPTIEDLLDEHELYSLGDGSIDLVETLADRVDALARGVLGDRDAHGDLSLRGFFHYLKTNYDGVLIRLEQVRRALEFLSPTRVFAFPTTRWRMCGLTSFDKPPLSLTTHLVPTVSGSRGIELRWLNCPDVVGGSEPPRGRSGPVRWLRALRDWQTRRRARRKLSHDGPLLLHSLFSDLGGMIVSEWERQGGEALAIRDFLSTAAAADDAVDIRACCMRLWETVEGDAICRSLLVRHGVSLWPYLGPLLKRIITEQYPGLYSISRRAQGALARHRAVILSGGMVEANYVLGRAASRAGVPFVSHHYGGFLGYSLLPTHERYDMAECDFFLCGGRAAEETFRVSSPLTRWRTGVRRAIPVGVGMPWLEALSKRVRANARKPRVPPRVMFVLNALVGDCRYLGYVFPPEIAYWRFTRRVVARLARSDVEVIVKLPLAERYPQQRSPLEDWLKSQTFGNVRVLAGVPLNECMEEADAFVIEGPSTPLLHVVATRSPLFLYIDKDVYRLVPAAREALRRRAAVFAESEDEFFSKLETALSAAASMCSSDTVDDTFLHDFCIGGDGGSLQRTIDFLRSQAMRHDQART